MKIHKRKLTVELINGRGTIENADVHAYNDSGAEWCVMYKDHTCWFPMSKFTMKQAMIYMVETFGLEA